MRRYTRFAVYWAPPAGSALAQEGAAWLGWDAATGQKPALDPARQSARQSPRQSARQSAQRPALPDPAGLDLAALTERPRRYGFHATLKAPFRLAEDSDAEALETAFEQQAAAMAPFEMPALTARWLGPFLALVPARDAPALSGFAGRWVEALEAHRAPLSPAEMARRRAAGLSARQDGYLQRWGYPYVFDEFRFHLTLTGPVADDTGPPSVKDAIMGEARARFGPLMGRPVQVTEVCLFAQTEAGYFVVLSRAPLGGAKI
ncbi:MAG: DUF1045 domain-containing protein [Pseudomonadota bacterium]